MHSLHSMAILIANSGPSLHNVFDRVGAGVVADRSQFFKNLYGSDQTTKSQDESTAVE